MFRFFSLLFLAVSVSVKPLNVVVLFADDWRHDTLGCAGNSVVKTPNLDAFEFLRTRPADKPFFLALAFFATQAEDRNPKQYLPQPESMSLYSKVTTPPNWPKCAPGLQC